MQKLFVIFPFVFLAGIVTSALADTDNIYSHYNRIYLEDVQVSEDKCMSAALYGERTHIPYGESHYVVSHDGLYFLLDRQSDGNGMYIRCWAYQRNVGN